ncbi:hypothetical protein C8J57DRAFT_1544449 [Mycena rebaudengoi]|nr:hypothetical protein C8J57DRAFT_1544449 [Mycena rebaudengoi]
MDDSSPLPSLHSEEEGVENKGKAKEEIRPLQTGMDKGYDLSPMAGLRLDYERDSESESSLYTRAQLLTSKKSLGVTDILDRGVNKLNAGIPRFCLEIGLGMRVDTTIRDLQHLMLRLASLVDGRKNHFIVDPHYNLMSILRGTSSLEELNIAWTALNTRVGLALKYFEKYDSEYKAEFAHDVLLSPVSMNAEIYSHIPTLQTNMDRLTYLYKEVSHHGDDLPSAFHEAEFPWLPNWLPTPGTLQDAFPDRVPELRPSMIYYHAETGERMERAPPSRSSWGAGSDFQAPAMVGEERRPHAIQRPASNRDRRGRGGDQLESVREENSQDIEYSRTAVGNTDSGYRPQEFPSASSANHYSILASTTPYKSSKEFFVPRSPVGAFKAHVVPAPNPLFSLASAKPPTCNEEPTTPTSGIKAGWRGTSRERTEAHSKTGQGQKPKRTPQIPMIRVGTVLPIDEEVLDPRRMAIQELTREGMAALGVEAPMEDIRVVQEDQAEDQVAAFPEAEVQTDRVVVFLQAFQATEDLLEEEAEPLEVTEGVATE